MNSLLRVEHVTISYNGKPMVEDVSFEVKQGEILGIVGESGKYDHKSNHGTSGRRRSGYKRRYLVQR